jgi:hypothetical protein
MAIVTVRGMLFPLDDTAFVSAKHRQHYRLPNDDPNAPAKLSANWV